MPPILLHPDGSRAELPPRARPYSFRELGLKLGFGRLDVIELVSGYLLLFNPEAPDLALPYNLQAVTFAKANAGANQPIHGSAIVIALEDVEQPYFPKNPNLPAPARS